MGKGIKVECGFLKDDYSLGMYLCRGGNACKEKQSASPECNRDYLYVKSYYHDCPRCSGRMKKIRKNGKKTS